MKGNKIWGKVTELEYGISITDACIGIEETENIILEAYNQISK